MSTEPPDGKRKSGIVGNDKEGGGGGGGTIVAVKLTETEARALSVAL